MKHITTRILALVMALVLALPALVLAEDEGGVLTLPESGIELEELNLTEADDYAQEDVDLAIGAPGDVELEIPVEAPVSVVEGEAVGEQVDLSGLEEPGEAAEPAPGAAEADDGALASNWDYVDVKYIDANGKQQGPVKCAKLRGGDDPVIGNGWYAVTKDMSYTVDMSVWGETNLILCDGATLTANSGIWVHRTARLTIWAQSTDEEQMGKLEAYASSNRAGIGGIKDHVGGTIVINGGNIEAKGGNSGAGIGAGQGEGSGFTRIEINGGHVYAEGNTENQNKASGIGSADENRSWGDVVITGGFVEAKGKSGYPGISGKNITISGNCTVKANGNGGGAGITGYRITIDGGNITAKGSTEFKINRYGIRLPDNGGAGIGESSMIRGWTANITINGGTVKATGGYEAAGIGSRGTFECRDITITGGAVTAKGGTSAAGIGGGGDLIGTIAISGGTVNATGDDGGAGIGAGLQSDASKGKVVITGGKVTARAGAGAAGIGGGRSSGKFGGAGSNVEIGGTADVTAWAGVTKRFDLCSAIGRGHRNGNFGTMKLADNMLVRAGKSDQAAEGSEPCASDQREDACKNNWFVHIRRCDHPGATYSDLNDKTHTLDACKYCLRGSKKEAHEIDPKTGRCRRCSYAPRVEITFDGNGAPGEMDSQKLTLANRESLEYNTYIWKGHTFKEWNTRKDGSGKSFANGAVPEFTDFTEDTTLYAQWYTNVTLVSSSLQVEWDGKPHAVKGFIVMDGSQRVDADFPKVRAGVEATDVGVYSTEFTGVKLKKTVDTTGKYLVTELIVGRLIITRLEQEITPPSAVKGLVYDGTEQKLVQGGKAVGGEMRYSLDKWNWSGSIPTARDAGAYTVYYLSRGDGNHRDTRVSQLTVTIARRELTVKADPKEKLIGDADPELTYTCAPALVKGDKLTGELTRDKGEEIGQYRIQIGTLTAGGNYKIRFEENWLFIRRRALPFPTAEPTAKPR